MHLYKYTSPCNARYAGSCSLKFSPPKAFNDPFDCLPDYSALREMPEFKNIAANIRAQALQKANGNPEQTAEIEALVWQTPTTRDAMEKYMDRLSEDGDKNFRVLCLSKHDPTTTEAALMMGHYGEDHQGFAYEFDATHPWFELHSTNLNPSRAYRSITYLPRRAAFRQDGPDSLFIKSSPWSYEAEVRLVRVIKDHDNDLKGPDKTIARYPPEMLTAIVVGCRAKDQLVQIIREQLASDPNLKHVRLFRLRRDTDLYRFNAQQI